MNIPPPPTEDAESYYSAHREDINRDLICVTNRVAAVACGVGLNTITAARAMIGQADNRRIYVGPLRKFFRDNPNWHASDAATEQSRALYWARKKSQDPIQT